MSFSPARFSIYSKDLSEALLQMSRERMQTRVIGSNKYVTLDGKTVMVGAEATEQEVAKALNLEKIDGQTTAVAVPKVTTLTPIAKNLTGASFLAQLIRSQQAAIKKQLADAGSEMSEAMSELQDVANEATNQVKAVKAETADLKAALGLNSNSDPT